jgi:isopenicillin-N epimerase
VGEPLVAPDVQALRRDSLLDPHVIFLNHGSFGACPRPVMDTFQAWQLELEREPVELLLRRAPDLLQAPREALAGYLGCSADDLVLVPNTTHGMNMVARALPLACGDRVVITDQEYGAVDVLWRVVCERSGATLVRAPLPVPLHSSAEALEAFRGVLDETVRVVSLSHITPYTGLLMPVEEVCRLAREVGATTVVDGAHAPAQIPLDLPAIGADFYVGSCHKWLCSPKVAGFLHTRPGVDVEVDPLLIGSTWDADGLAERSHWQGTQNLSAFLSVPAAIDYQRGRDWATVRERCAGEAAHLHDRLLALPDVRPVSQGAEPLFRQIVSVLLPEGTDPQVQHKLFAEHRIEVPVVDIQPGRLLRASVAAYNERRELDALVDALAALLGPA